MNHIARLFVVALVILTGHAHLLAQVKKTGPNLGKDAAYFVVGASTYRIAGKNVVRQEIDRPALLITTANFVSRPAAKDGTAFSLVEPDQGTEVIPLTLVDVGGITVPTTDPSVPAQNWFLFVPSQQKQLRTDGHYELRINYDLVTVWSKEEDSNGDAVATPIKGSRPVTVVPVMLESGKKIGNFGETEDDPDQKATQPDSAKQVRTGFAGILQDIDLKIIPQAADGSDELGLTYHVGYEIDRKRFGGSTPGSLSLDVNFDGRATTDTSSNTLTGYAQGGINARAMWLPGHDRYYPVGVRLAIGYEGGEDATQFEATGTGQVVASVPYIGDLLESWQETLGFTRAFAPPFVSFAYVGSGAEVAGDEQDRLEFECGWIAPIAEQWDFNVRWRHMDFIEHNVDSEQLLELDLTYYADKNLTHGLHMSFEEGFRSAVGDIGSKLLLGYKVAL